VAAFEPDLGNFDALVNATRAYPDVVLFPCGVGESTRFMGFSSGMGGASHIDPNAEDRIMCVALDDVLPNFHPNLIKMDVEGSEPEALFGARTLIANHRPILAISVYHHPDHLWRIPFLIDAWQLGYRFFLRGHAESSFYLVLYALPPELFNHGN
jgi:FkbM family methyltransferase